MAKGVKEHVEEALKRRRNERDFRSVAEHVRRRGVIMEAMKIQEEELKSSLRSEGGASDETGRKSERVREKLWNVSQSNGR